MRIIVVLFAVIFGFNPVFSQKIFFRNYTVMDGLCANTIWDIEQDDQGFMWYEFKPYQFDKKIKGTIGNNFIRKIFKFNSHIFWIGTEQGIYLFDLKTEKFKVFKQFGELIINDIFRDTKGDIWIASKQKGVFKYQLKENNLKNFTYLPNGKSFSSNEISKIIEDGKGDICIPTYSAGIDGAIPTHQCDKEL